jgi:hypothetical protein
VKFLFSDIENTPLDSEACARFAKEGRGPDSIVPSNTDPIKTKTVARGQITGINSNLEIVDIRDFSGIQTLLSIL